MKLRIGRNKKERNLVITVGLAILLNILLFALFHSRNTWKEDIDGDGVNEIIKEIRNPSGQLQHWVIEEDGTMYQTLYGKDGSLINKWKMIPDPTNPDEYTIYVRDEKTEQWLLDQNQNGIPDKIEEPDNSDG